MRGETLFRVLEIERTARALVENVQLGRVRGTDLAALNTALALPADAARESFTGSAEAGAIIASAVQVVSAYRAARRVAEDNPEDTDPILRPEGLAYRIAMGGLLDAVDAATGLDKFQGDAAARVAWLHGCDAICQDVTLWTPTAMACPHCGRPAPVAARRQEDDDA